MYETIDSKEAVVGITSRHRPGNEMLAIGPVLPVQLPAEIYHVLRGTHTSGCFYSHRRNNQGRFPDQPFHSKTTLPLRPWPEGNMIDSRPEHKIQASLPWYKLLPILGSRLIS